MRAWKSLADFQKESQLSEWKSMSYSAMLWTLGIPSLSKVYSYMEFPRFGYDFWREIVIFPYICNWTVFVLSEAHIASITLDLLS